MTSVEIDIQRLEHGQDITLPFYATDGAAGMDIRAAIQDPITIEPLERAMIPTGFALGLPEGYEAQIRPRSGLAAKQGLTVLNTPGTIDADYRGEIQVILVNLSNTPVTIERGDRIAQMVIAPVTQAQLNEVDSLSDTERGADGFGSTGVA